jgi:hypothetical protein
MREICKSGSMRGSGRPASNAPATLYSTVPCGEEGRGLGRLRPGARGARVVFWNSKDLKERKQAAWNFRFRVNQRFLGPVRWLDKVRGHWGGVKNRNHGRRDACMGEDGARTRNPTLLHGPHSERRVASAERGASLPVTPRPPGSLCSESFHGFAPHQSQLMNR